MEYKNPAEQSTGFLFTQVQRINSQFSILNSQFSARPEGTLSQSEATERILNLFEESKEHRNHQKDKGNQMVPVEALGLEAKGQDKREDNE